MSKTFTLSGTITYPRGIPAAGLIVRAYDKDMRSEQLLGQAEVSAKKGYYEIQYTDTQFSRAEKGTADIFIRVQDKKGNVLKQSEVVFNAAERTQINLEVEPVIVKPTEEKKLTEYERLLLQLKPVQEEIPPGDFTEEDIRFLTEELVNRRALPMAKDVLKEMLEFLRLSDQLNQESALPMAAFYGWLRTGLVFSTTKELAAFSTRLLLSKLKEAVGNRIIPDVFGELPTLQESLEDLPFETGWFIPYPFSVQLIEKASGEPLTDDFLITIKETIEGGEKHSSAVAPDSGGWIESAYYFPEDAKEQDSKKLHCQVQYQETKKIIAEFNLIVYPKEMALEAILIDVSATEKEATPVEQVVSERLASQLKALNIHTLNDVLNQYAKIEELADDPEAVTLVQHANWNVVEEDVAVQKVLIKAGYQSLLDVAKMPRAMFVKAMHKELKGDAKAAKLHIQALNYKLLFNNLLTEMRLNKEYEPNIAEVYKILGKIEICECEDCKSGVGILAYLADLLAYTIKTVKAQFEGDEEFDINTHFLRQSFCQPFTTLPLKCSSVDQKTRQVRLNIEVLRRLEPETLSVIDFIDIDSYEQIYHDYLVKTYEALLNLIGTNVEELQYAQPQGSVYSEAELNDHRRKAIASKIGVPIQNLPELYQDPASSPLPITEDWLESIFGLVSTLRDPFAIGPTSLMKTWQTERLKESWLSQDWPDDPYSPNRTIPIVDPYIIDETYIRIPIFPLIVPPSSDQHRVLNLWNTRRNIIETYRTTLQNLIITNTPLAEIINQELDATWGDLQSWHQSLRDGQNVRETFTAIAEIYLSEASFDRLVELTNQLLTVGDLSGHTMKPTTQEWVNILASAYKRSLYESWVQEEIEPLPNHVFPNLRFISSRLFHLPVQRPAPPVPWLSSNEERVIWENSFRLQNSLPLIDPDQVNWITSRANSQTHIFSKERTLWKLSRKIDLTRIKNSDLTDAEKLNAILAAGDEALGWNFGVFQRLAAQEVSGININTRLSQLWLDYSRFSFLHSIMTIITETGRPVSEDEWVQIIDIIVHAEKELLHAQWRREEQQAGIILSPDFFVLSNLDSLATRSENRWQKNIPAFIEHQNILKARLDQLDTIEKALKETVSKTEEQTLALLQDAMIFKVTIEQDTLEAKKRLQAEKRLLNFDIGACHLTTRVAEAIRVLHTFLWSTYTDILTPTQLFSWRFNTTTMEPGMLSLKVANSFEEDWTWIGSYPAWRAAMFVFLYPQNYLDPRINSRQSWRFQKMVNEQLLPPVTPEKACNAAKFYSDYLNDIMNLDVQSSCLITTKINRTEKCSSPTEDALLMHAFALAKPSGKIYYCNYPPNASSDTLASWKSIPSLVGVLEIIGTAPHETPSGDQYIVLFYKIIKDRKHLLYLIRYDLNRPGSRWSTAEELELPYGASDGFSGVVEQKHLRSGSSSSVGSIGALGSLVQPGAKSSGSSGGDLITLPGIPTVIYLRNDNGIIYYRQIDDYASGWKGEWLPVTGRVIGAKYKKVCASLQRSLNESILILETKDEKLFYRALSITSNLGKDTGKLDKLIDGTFIGAFKSVQDERIFVLSQKNGKYNISVIGVLGPFVSGGEEIKNIDDFNKSLTTMTGIDLEKTKFKEFELSATVAKVHRYNNISSRDPHADWTDWEEYRLSFAGIWNLLQILKLRSEIENFVDKRIRAYSIITENSFGDWGNKLSENLYFYDNLWWSKGFTEDVQISDDVGVIYNKVTENLIKNIREILQSLVSKIPSFFHQSGDWLIADFFTTSFINPSIRLIETISEYFNNPQKIISQKSRIVDNEVTHYKNVPNPKGISNIVPFCGEEVGQTCRLFIQDEYSSYRVNINISEEIEVVNISNNNIGRISMKKGYSGPVIISNDSDQSTLQNKKRRIENAYRQIQDGPPSLLSYLYEAYHGVPIYMALNLQSNGFYEEALSWYREVFDFNTDFKSNNSFSKIDYLLTLNSSTNVSNNFNRAEGWLSDPLDPHGIAGGRKDTYTTYVVQQIIRCLVEYADTEFTVDNVESNERARRLYEKALQLFETKELYFSPETNCSKLIREFEIEVQEGFKFPDADIKGSLNRIRDMVKLRATLDKLREINRDSSLSGQEKVVKMQLSLENIEQEKPPIKTLDAILMQQEQDHKRLEPWVLSLPAVKPRLSKSLKKRGKVTMANIAQLVNTTPEELETKIVDIPSLRDLEKKRIPPPPHPKPSRDGEYLPLFPEIFVGRIGILIPNVSFDFCVPQNPILSSLYTQATNNLFKLNHCMNIAGMKRQVQPYAAATDSISGMPSLGSFGQWNLPGVLRGGNLKPTLYRYAFLMLRAKELVQQAAQIESSLLAALEKRDEESLRLLQARQSVELAQMSLRLQDLRVQEALQGVVLAGLQQDRSALQVGYYQGLLNTGLLDSEQKTLSLLRESSELQFFASGLHSLAASLLQSAVPLSAIAGAFKADFGAGLRAQADVFSTLASEYSSQASALSTESSIYSTQASYERRSQDWSFQKSMAEQDMVIGSQQIQLAKMQTQIVQQERNITEQQVEQAAEVLQFLLNKTTGFALYDWMTGILKQAYNYFLQNATATARLAENQLSFERQEPSPAIIQTNYWNMPGYAGNESKELGLTGSARLMADLARLEQYGLDSDKRKNHFLVRFSMAQLFPMELQQLRETGEMTFATTLQMIDERFPGAYLCQIKEVSITVIALTDPVEGIKATLVNSGVSRVVVGAYTFQTLTINRAPEVVVFSGAPIDNTGNLNLTPDQANSMFLPFENTGFEALWQLNLPRAANAFNFESIADIIITIKCTSLFSFDYQRQVQERLRRDVSAMRTFSFRSEFADQWYDLHHPDLTERPMVVNFTTTRSDFPSRLQDIRIQQIILYFVKADASEFEIPVNTLFFAQDQSVGRVGGTAQSIGRMINTRFGNGISWINMIGKRPFGKWELDLSGTLDGIDGYLSNQTPLTGLSVRDLFTRGEIRDILFVVTYNGHHL